MNALVNRASIRVDMLQMGVAMPKGMTVTHKPTGIQITGVCKDGETLLNLRERLIAEVQNELDKMNALGHRES